MRPKVSLEDGTSGTNKIVLNPTTQGQEYAVVDKATGEVVNAANGWKRSTDGGSLEFDGLDPAKDYQVVTRTPAGNGKDASVPTKGLAVPHTTVKPNALDSTVEENGKTKLIVKNTDADTKYAVADKNGTIIAPIGNDQDGWISGNGGEIAFPGLSAGEEYTVVSVAKRPGDTDPESGATAENVGNTTDNTPYGTEAEAPVGPSVMVPAAAESQLTAEIKDGDPKTASITISPADPDLKYGLLDENGNELKDLGDWKAVENGQVVFEGLVPNTKYIVVAKPAAAGDEIHTPDKKDSGTPIVTPKADITAPAGAVLDDGTEGKDKIVVSPTVNGQEYAVIDQDTGKVVAPVKSGSGASVEKGWQTSDGADLTFDGLEPGKNYQVVTRTPAGNGKDASVPVKGVEITKGAAKPGNVAVSAAPNGKTSLTVKDTDPDTKYAVVDKATGKVVAPVDTKGGGTKNDDDGWQTGNHGTLTFAPIPVGGEYVVVSVPKDSGRDTDGTGGGNAAGSLYPDAFAPAEGAEKPAAGPSMKVPAVAAGQLSGSVDDKRTPATDDDKAAITISPADTDMEYGLVAADGTTAKDWTSPTDGRVVFDELDPNTRYTVVARPKPAEGVTDETTPADRTGAGTAVVTPDSSAADIDRVTADSGKNNGRDTITLSNTDTGHDYALVDPMTGKVVAPVDTTGDGTADNTTGWQQGSKGDITFQGLDPNKEYEVVVRPHAADSTVISIPNTPGTPVGKVGTVNASGIVKDSAGNPVPNAAVKVAVATPDGGYKTLSATTDAEGKYTFTAEGVKLPNDYTVYVESAAGVAGSTQSFTKTQPQALADITVETAEGGNTNLAAGVVSSYGRPVNGKTVTIRDKGTGEVLSPQPGGVLETKNGGGYTVENLPDGTYIIETSAEGVSGMTEITVKNGKTAPNKEGGYKNTDISLTPGYLVSGKVAGLGEGEKATVTVDVPLYDADGKTVIGAKTFTSVAVGPEGYYQFAGVPNGSYPVTAITADGKSAAKLTDTVNSAGLTDQDITVTAPEDPGKPGVLTGVVLDSGNHPIAGAVVTLYNEQGEKLEVSASTGAGGGYSFTDLPDGTYYISADSADKHNGLAGPVKVTGTKAEGGTTVRVSDEASRLLVGKVTGSDGKPTQGAGVEVKARGDSGDVLGTTSTNANGIYFVGGVTSNAKAAAVTKTGETGGKDITGSNDPWNGDMQTQKSNTELTVLGPDGMQLPVYLNPTGNDAKITVTQDNENRNGAFDFTGGVLNVKEDTPDGVYSVTVEKNGMNVTKEITVSGGELKEGSPYRITGASVAGTVKFENGAVPSEAQLSVPGWGSAKVNTNTGKYELPNLPDGTFEARLTMTDSEAGVHTVSTIIVPLTVKDGKAVYDGEKVTGDENTGATASVKGADLTVLPTKQVKDVQDMILDARDKIAAAQADPGKTQGAISAIQTALGNIDDLTEEGLRQLDDKTFQELTNALSELLKGALVFQPKAKGMKNPSEVVKAIQNQQGMLVSADELTAATGSGTNVDISLAMKVTDEETSTVKKDLPKVEAVVVQTGAEDKAVFEIVVEKTTVVKDTETEQEISASTANVTKLPAPVQVVLNIPQELQGYRYYSVVRVHENKAERIPSTATVTQVTFRSNLYSTYAILAANEPIYADDSQTGGSGGTGGVGGSGDVPEEERDVGDPHYNGVADLLVVDDHIVYLHGNEKGNFAPNANMTRAEAAQMFYNLLKNQNVETTKTFSDVPSNAWYGKAVSVLAELGILKGVGGDKFAPGRSITRAEFAGIAMRFADKVEGGKTFTDVTAKHWAYESISGAAYYGWIDGYPDGTFRPEDHITRAEAAKLVNAMLARHGDESYISAHEGTLKTFPDVQKKHWAYADVMEAANAHEFTVENGAETWTK